MPVKAALHVPRLAPGGWTFLRFTYFQRGWDERGAEDGGGYIRLVFSLCGPCLYVLGFFDPVAFGG